MTFALASCGLPELGPRPETRPPASLATAQTFARASAVAANWPQEQWWKAYGDPQLDALVAEALAGSPDVSAAQARVRQARGAVEITGADTLPQIGAQGSAGVTKQSYNNGIPPDFVPRGWKSTGNLALTGDFDLDLWGRRRKLLAAATSEAQAAQADASQASLILASNVVSSYFDLARLLARDEALVQAAQSRESLGALTRRRAEQGLENQSPVRQSQAETLRSRIALSANREQLAARRNALAALLGAGPDRGLAIKPTGITQIPETPLPADAGIALAGRRPDIVAARLRVEAAGKRIDIAKTAYLPNISLSGLIGLTSLGVSNLFDSGSTYGNGVGAFSLPIFDGGRIRGEYRQARGSFDLAVADYNSTVVDALREIADALATRDAARAQEADAAAARREAEAAYDLANKRYDAGLSSFIEALSAQQVAIESREAAIDAHFRTLAAEVALKRALGGGFAQDMNEKVTTDE
ncbi:NodT family efflux transporter outer membrane factor (OMF) lipoprotein [Novosphingobium chloroacetimidivorans]|uniref:NodT family efflux transporter outer membrane factor (OMF) lipoprotein n=1 Tax=Novosphingobium chloroacetimidivorans TaxID=1428314 RepID=A0A7W7NWT5_9SPHN|nr:efflux transporter outer membrane subunit [Novosphingobium chloroacetimidivorans]MBB4858485.1 NodT family efflux transporter outer membrane factor (OMF) lipoprotein [Novosphingobium chloroacetimidivorans]